MVNFVLFDFFFDHIIKNNLLLLAGLYPGKIFKYFETLLYYSKFKFKFNIIK
jgi:hypothetical protein